MSLGLSSPDATEIRAAVERVTEAARAASKAVFAFVTDREDAARLEGQGVTAFVMSSDQGFLRAGATRALDALRAV